MEQLQIAAPCHFGMEAVLKREIYDLGYEISRVEDGRVIFEGDYEALAYANIHLRTPERILLVLAEFEARSWEELFQGIRAIAWEDYLPKDAKFWVTKATSVKSKLFSARDIQSIVKKAVVDRMSRVYGIAHFPEIGTEYPLRIFIMKDRVMVTLDSTGLPLHKRGYRTFTSKAPLSETLAAGLLMLTPWHPDRILMDPFCGSGTILIEAAMMAANIAPGLDRSFTGEQWINLIDPQVWREVRADARGQINPNVKTNLQGYDLDPKMVEIARQNASRAGVADLIHFQQRDIRDTAHPKKYGFILTNPPYGERLEDQKDLPELYMAIGRAYRNLDDWSMYLITSYEDAQKYLGRKADKNRKIYNGMIKTYFYQYLGPKPPKRKKQEN